MFYENMAIYCSTEEEAADLMRMISAEGIRWNSGKDPLEYMPFNPRIGTWYSITRIINPLRGDRLVLTYCHGEPSATKDYQRVEYTNLICGNRKIHSITSIDAFV